MTIPWESDSQLEVGDISLSTRHARLWLRRPFGVTTERINREIIVLETKWHAMKWTILS